jgi:hypothetical protein
LYDVERGGGWDAFDDNFVRFRIDTFEEIEWDFIVLKKFLEV